MLFLATLIKGGRNPYLAGLQTFLYLHLVACQVLVGCRRYFEERVIRDSIFFSAGFMNIYHLEYKVQTITCNERIVLLRDSTSLILANLRKPKWAQICIGWETTNNHRVVEIKEIKRISEAKENYCVIAKKIKWSVYKFIKGRSYIFNPHLWWYSNDDLDSTLKNGFSICFHRVLQQIGGITGTFSTMQSQTYLRKIQMWTCCISLSWEIPNLWR